MKVIEFIEMLNTLTDEQKQLTLNIEYNYPSFYSEDLEITLDAFVLDRVLDYAGYVIVKGQ